MEIRSTPTASATVARLRARVRALEAELDLRAEEVAPRIWSVPSISTGGVHVVCRHGGRWTCDCTAAEHHRYCAHLAAVELLAERQVFRPQRAARVA